MQPENAQSQLKRGVHLEEAGNPGNFRTLRSLPACWGSVNLPKLFASRLQAKGVRVRRQEHVRGYAAVPAGPTQGKKNRLFPSAGVEVARVVKVPFCLPPSFLLPALRCHSPGRRVQPFRPYRRRRQPMSYVPARPVASNTCSMMADCFYRRRRPPGVPMPIRPCLGTNAVKPTVPIGDDGHKMPPCTPAALRGTDAALPTAPTGDDGYSYARPSCGSLPLPDTREPPI